MSTNGVIHIVDEPLFASVAVSLQLWSLIVTRT